MWSSALLFACITVNVAILGRCAIVPVGRLLRTLQVCFRQLPRYLRLPLSETREAALRQRCMRTFAALGTLLLALVILLLGYAPSLGLAHALGRPEAALLSIEAVAGMLAGGVAIVWRRHKS